LIAGPGRNDPFPEVVAIERDGFGFHQIKMFHRRIDDFESALARIR